MFKQKVSPLFTGLRFSVCAQKLCWCGASVVALGVCSVAELVALGLAYGIAADFSQAGRLNLNNNFAILHKCHVAFPDD